MSTWGGLLQCKCSVGVCVLVETSFVEVLPDSRAVDGLTRLYPSNVLTKRSALTAWVGYHRDNRRISSRPDWLRIKFLITWNLKFSTKPNYFSVIQNGDEIRDEGDCEVCTCEDEGVMNCVEMTCPDLNCEEDELVSYREDQCCPYCQSDWVEVG